MNESFMGAESELTSNGEWNLKWYALSEVRNIWHLKVIEERLIKKWRLLYIHLHRIERTAYFSKEVEILENRGDGCIFNCFLLFVTISCFITFFLERSNKCKIFQLNLHSYITHTWFQHKCDALCHVHFSTELNRLSLS